MPQQYFPLLCQPSGMNYLAVSLNFVHLSEAAFLQIINQSRNHGKQERNGTVFY